MDYQGISRDELGVMGAFRSPWLRRAFDAVDREAFAPAQFWSYDTDADGLHLVIDRAADEEAWRRAVWGTHRSLIMQIDDAVLPEHGPRKGTFTSSISALDIAFEKLNQLDVEAGQRILHIGTASGYDTALLCEAVGSTNVTTIEYDRVMAARGAANLEAAGYAPTARWGDGLAGWVPNAPYDRIITTAAVRNIPNAWRDQAAERAIILAPYNTLFTGGGLLKLTVHGGTATGRFVGGACYMWVRSHRPLNEIRPPAGSRKHASVLDPNEVFAGGWSQQFVLGLYLPDVAFSHRGCAEEQQVQLWDETGTSVAIVNYDKWWLPGAVTLYGERNLWAELVGVYSAWRHAGEPHYRQFGLTFDNAGERLWLDDPANVLRSARKQ